MMNSYKNFIVEKCKHSILARIVDCYFYIDIPVCQLQEKSELIIPFPRITFGYFFDFPFNVFNESLHSAKLVNNGISRISLQKVNVLPSTDRIRIVGAHLKPIALAYFTRTKVKSLPWFMDIEELFGSAGKQFKDNIQHVAEEKAMFTMIEELFLSKVEPRDSSIIENAMKCIEKKSGNVDVTTLSEHLGISDRTLRNHFYQYIGCSPKNYMRIVKLVKTVYQMRYAEGLLTEVAYSNNYFDQAHFINEIQDLTGYSPGKLRKEILSFRFLQF